MLLCQDCLDHQPRPTLDEPGPRHRLGDAPLVAELVAKWRMVGSLAAMPAARNSDDPLLTMVPNSTPEPDETLTRTLGPNLVLPHPRATPLYQHPTIADRPRAHYR